MDKSTETQAQLKKLSDVSSILQKLQAKKRTNAEDTAKIEELVAEVAKLSKQVATKQAKRKGEFSEEDAERLIQTDFSGTGSRALPGGSMKALHQLRSKDEAVADVHRALDDMYILKSVVPGWSPQDSEYVEYAKASLPLLAKAMSTTEGASWIPTDFSAAMHEQVRLQLKVAALHSRINMPTSTYKLPIEGADPSAYLVSEQGLSDADLTDTNRVKASFGTSAGTDTPNLTNLTLTAKKIGARLVFSAELVEESIIPMLPYLRDKIALSMAQAQEDALINGDTDVGTGSALDSDMVNSANLKHRRKAWDGYRSLAPAGSKVAVAGAKVIDIADIRKLREYMGKYAISPSDVAIVTGPLGYARLLSTKDGSQPSPIMTIEKYGAKATIVTGELARIDGIPIILSEFVREDLNASGVYDGVTTDRTQVFMVNKAQFLFGDYRRPTLKSREIIETDQTVLVTLQRLTFAGWFANAKTVGFLYNV